MTVIVDIFRHVVIITPVTLAEADVVVADVLTALTHVSRVKVERVTTGAHHVTRREPREWRI